MKRSMKIASQDNSIPRIRSPFRIVQFEMVYDRHFDRPKTKRSARTIPIGTETAEILGGIRSVAADANALVFATRALLDVVFTVWRLANVFTFSQNRRLAATAG